MEVFGLKPFSPSCAKAAFPPLQRPCYRTQPAISQTIKKLEDEIGRPLLNRSSRRGVLTDAGRVLADHAERLVNLRSRAMAALDDVRQFRTGRLTMRGERVDLSVSATDSARIPAALSRSPHHRAARTRQPRAGAGARLWRRLWCDHLSTGHDRPQFGRRLSRELRFVVRRRIRSRAARKGID